MIFYELFIIAAIAATSTFLAFYGEDRSGLRITMMVLNSMITLASIVIAIAWEVERATDTLALVAILATVLCSVSGVSMLVEKIRNR